MNSKYIPKANTRQILVSVKVSDVNNKTFSFTENRELTAYAKNIVSMQSFHAGQVAKTKEGKAVINQAAHDTSFLEVKDGSTSLRVIPLKTLSLQAPQTEVPLLNLEVIDLQQSTITIADIAALVLNEEYFFLVTYEKKDNV